MSARMLALIVLLASAVASGIGVVATRQQSRQLFAALAELERERDELNIEYGRLQLEQATWTETNRLEQLARTQLEMVFPGAAETIVIRR
jgi:cell division protein FtsL